jgi:hypothetical protein
MRMSLGEEAPEVCSMQTSISALNKMMSSHLAR